MRQSRTLLLTFFLVVGLLLPAARGGAPPITTSGLAATSNATGERAPAPDLSRRQAKKDDRQKHKQKKHKQNKRKQAKRNQTKRKHQRQNQQRRRAHQARQLATGVLPGADTAAPPPDKPLSAEGRYIVQLRQGAGDERQVTRDIAAANTGVVPTHVYRYVFPGFAAVIPPDKLAAVAADPRVQAVVPDAVGHADAQVLPTGVNRIDADLNPTANINGVDQRVDVDVAVVDTAGNNTHEDLNVWAWGNCTPSHNNSDDDEHGTHVGGTIGALDNGIGVVGVAPGARLWNIKVMIHGSYLNSWVICGMDLVTHYATDQGDGFGDIEVANGSFGGPGSDAGGCAGDPFHQAFCNTVAAGVTVVVAAGNDNANANTKTPASYDEVITVSALVDSDGRPGGLGPSTSRGPDDSLANFSNFGADVDIAAPGVNILSTVPGGYDGTFSGTSMASPHVAGAAALYMANHLAATPDDVKTAILAARIETGPIPGDSDGFNEGVLNVGGSFAAAAAAQATGPSSEDGAARAEMRQGDSGKRGKRHGKAKASKGQRHRR